MSEEQIKSILEDIPAIGGFTVGDIASEEGIDQAAAEIMKLMQGEKEALQNRVKELEGELERVKEENAPLFTNTPLGWECTENGMKELLVAVPYRSTQQPGKELWWIKHCVIQDEVGLCVVGDDDNEPAGWDMSDVTHYKILDFTPPKHQTDAE